MNQVTANKELQQITASSETKKRFADKLYRVWLLDGQEVWILIHIEVQSQYMELMGMERGKEIGALQTARDDVKDVLKIRLGEIPSTPRHQESTSSKGFPGLTASPPH
jgi:hypothetical protein